jgi:hypothetical protein
MSDIIQLTDFESGEYTIPQDCYSDIQPYLDKYEKKYLIELLGCELYDLFIADLVGGVPQTQIYIDIYNEICEDEGSSIVRSEGMKTMLIELVYFYIVRDLAVKKSSSGVGFNVNEVTEGPTYSGFNIVESFNEGVKNYNVIQWYMSDNHNDYPTRNGVCLGPISGI